MLQNAAKRFAAKQFLIVSEETIKNCFFRGLRLGVPDGSFFRFSLNKNMPNLADESYEEYLSIEDGFEIAGCPTNAEICEEVMQSRKEGGEDDTAENRPQKTQKTRRRHRKNKEVVAWLDAMRRQFQFQGMNMDLYFK